MNNTKHTIGWCDKTWNPITGCKHGCWYCYARKLTQRFKKVFPNGFEPTFHPERLHEPYYVKNPSKIFVCSIADLFAPWTPKEWRDAILTSIEHCPIPHTFQLLTKNPELIPSNYAFPKNVWVGTTVTNEFGDFRNIKLIKRIHAKVKFVSFEPLLDALPPWIGIEGLDWIIVGKLTGSRKVELKKAWVEDIVAEAKDLGIPVFTKNNLCPPFEKDELIQQFPKV